MIGWQPLPVFLFGLLLWLQNETVSFQDTDWFRNLKKIKLLVLEFGKMDEKDYKVEI